MTKIEMINMAIDLGYVRGRITKLGGMEDCNGNLVNAIDNLVETIVGEGTSYHDGCEGCYYFDTDYKDQPCNECKMHYADKYTIGF